MSGPERKIEEKIITALEKRGFLVEWLMMRGERGWPDLSVFKDGLAMLIEVKKPGGRASANQLRKQAQLSKFGMTMLIVDNVETAVNEVIAWFAGERSDGCELESAGKTGR